MQHTGSTEALREALLTFPTVVPFLAQRAEINLPSSIESSDLFRVWPVDKQVFSSSYLTIHSNRSLQIMVTPRHGHPHPILPLRTTLLLSLENPRQRSMAPLHPSYPPPT